MPQHSESTVLGPCAVYHSKKKRIGPQQKLGRIKIGAKESREEKTAWERVMWELEFAHAESHHSPWSGLGLS